MNKEQSADDPSVDLIRVKNMLNSTISMSYLMLAIACIDIRCLWKHSEQLSSVGEARYYELFPGG